ncbi:hypothetical protein ACMD2_15167 [Ananas comosus]|uniref:Uncharacterized protein n=1 Tax=Ananas comosus TaxID=4615 RepID=A0A199V5K4_ANACO|nr:hypothetical protein ACMD2_15167 [Ananas comosus]
MKESINLRQIKHLRYYRRRAAAALRRFDPRRKKEEAMAASPPRSPPRVIARHVSFFFLLLLLLLLPLLALSKSSPRPITGFLSSPSRIRSPGRRDPGEEERVLRRHREWTVGVEVPSFGNREGELRPAVPFAAMLRAHLRRRSLGRRGEGLCPRARVQILHAQVVHGRQPRRCEGGLQFLTSAHAFTIVTFAPPPAPPPPRPAPREEHA